MSYDLMVFAPEAAPRERAAFISWYMEQTEWGDGRSYNDPAVATPELRAWFADVIEQFPPMNGPLASDDFDDPSVTDYSIGEYVIYAAFAWSQAEAARQLVVSAADAHGVGFFDVSSDEGLIVYPGETSAAPVSVQQPRKPWWKLW